MQDQDAPPVEEGEIGGGVVVVRAAATQADHVVATNNTAASIPRRWTTAIARHCPATTMAGAPDANDPASRRIIPSRSPTRFRFVKTPRRGSSVSSTIS